MGYDENKVTGRSGDGRIDVTAVTQNGIIRVPIAVQVKRKRTNIGGSTVNQLRGSMSGMKLHQTVVITTSRFTESAKLRTDPAITPPITLIDGEDLVKKLIDCEVGVSTRKLELYEKDTTYFGAPEAKV